MQWTGDGSELLSGLDNERFVPVYQSPRLSVSAFRGIAERLTD